MKKEDLFEFRKLRYFFLGKLVVGDIDIFVCAMEVTHYIMIKMTNKTFMVELVSLIRLLSELTYCWLFFR